MALNPQLPSLRKLLSLISGTLRHMRRETKLKEESLEIDSEGAFMETDWNKLVELGVLERSENGFSLAEVSSVDWHGPETVEEAFAKFRRG
jgi:hypothetical protein